MFGTIANLFGTKKPQRTASNMKTPRLGLERLEGRDCPSAASFHLIPPPTFPGSGGGIVVTQPVIENPIVFAPVRVTINSPVISAPVVVETPIFFAPALPTGVTDA